VNVINFFAGPGAGKSTTASGLFCLMKQNGDNVELVTEFAKDLTWEGNLNCLKDQLFVSATQNHRLFRLIDEVDWVVTDSPLLLSLLYKKSNYYDKFDEFMLSVFNSYNNFNFFINRTKDYVQSGRTQTLHEAQQLDSKIKLLLKNLKIPYTSINGNKSASKVAFEIIKHWH